MINVIIFDFDGVIADSNSIKTDAFVKLFESYPQYIRDIVKKFHLQNGGMSRFDKFRHIYANFLKEPLPEKMFDQLCSDFNRLVIDGVIKAPVFTGVLEFLENNKHRYAMHIVSGTPEDEIKEVTKKKELNRYFLDICGSPRSKKELINLLIKKNGYKKEEVVFLGDSINDYEGAVGAGIEFVAKIDDRLAVEQFPNLTLKTRIRNMEEFERYLNEKNKK